jgi:hypothetical protein
VDDAIAQQGPALFVMIGNHDCERASGRVSGRALRRMSTHLRLRSCPAEMTAGSITPTHRVRTDHRARFAGANRYGHGLRTARISLCGGAADGGRLSCLFAPVER